MVSDAGYDPAEQHAIGQAFGALLEQVTEDGGRKRQAATKVPWTVDPDHEAGLFSHLARWKRGEMVDPDSGAHPLVHVAWRCLALAYQDATISPSSGGERSSEDPEAKWISHAAR